MMMMMMMIMMMMMMMMTTTTTTMTMTMTTTTAFSGNNCYGYTNAPESYVYTYVVFLVSGCPVPHIGILTAIQSLKHLKIHHLKIMRQHQQEQTLGCSS
jgi:hypothetical protein